MNDERPSQVAIPAPARLIVAPDADAFVSVAAERIAAEIRGAVAARGVCSLALAGGETPRRVYERLARAADLPWGQVTILFGDERAVPPDDPESNYRMATEALLARLSTAPRAVHRMEAEDRDGEAAARRYEAVLPGALDILILGMGNDGHTASLFPGSPAVEERHRLVLAVPRPRAPWRGLTITPPVIARALQVLVLVSGAAKAEMVERVLAGTYTPRQIPAQLARRGEWILDHAAAGRLRESDVH